MALQEINRWLTAALFSFGVAGVSQAADLIGHASVIDGDTIEIHGERIRLWSI